ncbi:hypothetical protein ACHAPO_006873 [Fusarium lateritium]
MRYSHTLSGLLTVAMSATGLAQMTPIPTTDMTTTSGGMNVPTSVTSALPDTVTDTTTSTGTMTTMVKPTKTASPEVCCYECTTVYDECCAIPGADIAICKKSYTVCLGYNPWDIVPYVKPSVCKHEPYPPKHDDGKCVCGTGSCFTPDICAYECTTVYDQCCAVPGADIAICKEKYTVCLGYNPWGVVPYTKPSVCKHEKQYYIDYESKYDEHYFYEKYSSYYESGHYSSSSYSTSSYHEGYYTAEYCCLECTTIYDECCAIPGADIAICKEKYTVCLGYSPFDIVPYTKPSVCKHEESYYKEYETSHGKDYYNSKYDNYGHKEIEITVEECCVECTTIYDECCLKGDIEVCKKEYTVCLGYNPWDVVPYVKPTVCKYENSGSKSKGDTGYNGKGNDSGYNGKGNDSGYNGKGNDSGYNGKGNDSGYHGSKSGSEEECCVQCTTVYDECCSIDGHDIETCKSEYTVCLGYSPFDVTPYVKPTVCKHGDNSGSKSKGDTGYNGKGGDSGYDSKTGGDKSDSNSKSKGDTGYNGSKSGSDEECCVQCTTGYKACCDASGAIIETCKEAYTVCLGYNPWDVVPFVEPSVCKHGKPSGDDVVIVSGGDRVRPVLALIAVGAFALLC